MSKLDMLYQQAVDIEAKNLLTCTISELNALPEYGNFITSIEGNSFSIGFNQYKFDDEHRHIVFTSDRRVFWFLYRKFISGVKVEAGVVSLLSEDEAAEYD